MRPDMRIDESTRAKLREPAAEAGLTRSETVRRLIDDAYRRLPERRRRRSSGPRVARAAPAAPKPAGRSRLQPPAAVSSRTASAAGTPSASLSLTPSGPTRNRPSLTPSSTRRTARQARA